MSLTCPRDGTELQKSQEDGVPCDECPQCKGAWFTLAELEVLEATVADSNAMAGTLEYDPQPDEIKCPLCGQTMKAFDFRGEDLRLDACDADQGFWLDSDEAERLRELMRQRQHDLSRSAHAERAWSQDREREFKPTVIERIESFILGGPRRF